VLTDDDSLRRSTSLVTELQGINQSMVEVLNYFELAYVSIGCRIDLAFHVLNAMLNFNTV